MAVTLESFESVIAHGLGGGVAEVEFRIGGFELREFGLEAIVGLIVDFRLGIFIIEMVVLSDFGA